MGRPTPRHTTSGANMRVSTASSEFSPLDEDVFSQASEASLSGPAFESIDPPVGPKTDTRTDALQQTVQQRLADRLGELAQDPERFHNLLRSAYGEGYDAAAGEALRQRALAGDTSWMPPVRLVDAQ